VRVLLDTHVLLWWLINDVRLSPRVRKIMGDGRNDLLWSVASSWELAIKVGLGKLRVPGPLRSYIPTKLQEQNIQTLPVEHAHAFEVAELPTHHKDPFDRLLIAQARIEGLPLISVDEQFAPYDIEVIWS
jgi:PIN domain nuclease of toxin-antitoxin system